MRKIVLLLFCAFFYENILFGQNGVLENANNYFWNNLYNRYQDLPSGFSSDEEYIRETNEHNYQVRQDLDRMRRESEERIKNIYLNVPNIVEKELSSHQVNAPTTSSSNTSSTYNTSNTYKSTGDYTVYKSGGLQIEVDNSPLRTPEKNNYYAQQKQKKAQRDAQRAAFNEERRRRMEEAARIAAIKKQMEDARKRKLYKENYIAATQADIDKTNAIADAKATIGRQAVLDRTSELWSQRYYKQEYVPVSPKLKSSVDLSSIVSSEFKDRNVIDLLGVGTSNYYDYQSQMDAIIRNAAKQQLKHVQHDGSDKNSYDMYETDDVKDQNLAQYMYSKYITENIMNVEDWWDRNNMSERLENVKNFLGEAVTDPVGTLNNARESLVDDIKENITLENIAKKSVGLIPDRFENVKNIGNCEVKMVFNVFSKDGAKQTVDAVFSGNMQYVEKKQEYITRQVNNLALETAGIKNGDKITEAALLHNKPKTEQNEWLKNYLTNKATEPSNYVKREATGKIKEIVKKEIDPKGTIF